jgi:hypothetical protein
MSTKSYRQNYEREESQELNELKGEKKYFCETSERLARQLTKVTEILLDDIKQEKLEKFKSIVEDLHCLNDTLQKIIKEDTLRIIIEEVIEKITAEDIKEITMRREPISERALELLKVDPSKTIPYRQDGFDFRRSRK